MSSLSRELVFLILQFLDEEKFKETVHKLEQESGFFFNMKYFEDQVVAGEWEEVERYLSGFTKVDDNRYSMKIFFEIRKQKYLEALDKQDRGKAVDILVKDLKVFASFNEELYKEITQLLTLDNFRENEQLSKYGDTKSARNIMLLELKKLIEANPLFRDKLAFPGLKASRLRTLINQSLNWQHQLCKNPRPNPDIKTLFVDHTCGSLNGGRGPAPAPPNALMPGGPKPGAFPIGVHSQIPPGAATANALAGWMANSNAPASHASMGAQPQLTAPSAQETWPGHAAALLTKRPRTPPAAVTEGYPSADNEHAMKRGRPLGDEPTFGTSSSQQAQERPYTAEDLPQKVARSLPQGSCVMSMDFHPYHQTLLLVGTSTGDIAIWEVGHAEKLAEQSFKLWEPQGAHVMQNASMKDGISVNRVIWSPDGQLLGVAFSKYIVHIYTYTPSKELRQHLEIDAHMGGVNDLAFSHPNKQLCVITCGDDKTIKVWDAGTGRKQYTFEGHEAPVYSVCPHHKESIQFIFSTAIDGKIKAWLYDHLGSRVDYDAPGKWCTTMAYSADGTRLFSCGTSKDGESSLVEWNESEGAIKRTYAGFRKRSLGVVQFDTIRNRFLAAGDEFLIKFWDMDSTTVLQTIDAENGLPASPRLRFNKEGSLLAVTTADNGIKILANRDGLGMLRNYEPARPVQESKPMQHQLPSASTATAATASAAATTAAASPANLDRLERTPSAAALTGPQNGMDSNQRSVKVEQQRPQVEESRERERKDTYKIFEVDSANQCRTARLVDNMGGGKVARLIYTNSGCAVLALASSAIHKLWKWPREVKATTAIQPAMFQPGGIVMKNDVTDVNPEDGSHCIALSKNDSYVMSASGGKISLFNMFTFKVMTTFMPPPPTATFLAFHPQDNNIIAIGMEDSTIQIYNVRLDEPKSKLKGHTRRISGLAFSNAQNCLVSSGADSQVIVWATDSWEKRTSWKLSLPNKIPSYPADTRVQFHNDQTNLLVQNESQISVYDATNWGRKSLWAVKDGAPNITCSTYSCDSSLVIAGFVDGTACVFDAETLRPRARISSSVYSTPNSGQVYPVVVAAHPQEVNQFALGLSDGGVQVFEPLESDNKWGNPPPVDNGSAANNGLGSGTGTSGQGAVEMGSR